MIKTIINTILLMALVILILFVGALFISLVQDSPFNSIVFSIILTPILLIHALLYPIIQSLINSNDFVKVFLYLILKILISLFLIAIIHFLLVVILYTILNLTNIGDFEYYVIYIHCLAVVLFIIFIFHLIEG